MRVLDGEQILVRIFLGESDRFHHTPRLFLGHYLNAFGARGLPVDDLPGDGRLRREQRDSHDQSRRSVERFAGADRGR